MVTLAMAQGHESGLGIPGVYAAEKHSKECLATRVGFPWFVHHAAVRSMFTVTGTMAAHLNLPRAESPTGRDTSLLLVGFLFNALHGGFQIGG